jgi:hypothetical protein
LFSEIAQCLSRMKSNLYLEFDFNPKETDKLVNIKTVGKNVCQLWTGFVIKCERDVWSCSFILHHIHCQGNGSHEGGREELIGSLFLRSLLPKIIFHNKLLSSWWLETMIGISYGSQFLWVRNLWPSWSGSSAQGLSWVYRQNIGQDCRLLKLGWGWRTHFQGGLLIWLQSYFFSTWPPPWYCLSVHTIWWLPFLRTSDPSGHVRNCSMFYGLASEAKHYHFCSILKHSFKMEGNYSRVSVLVGKDLCRLLH